MGDGGLKNLHVFSLSFVGKNNWMVLTKDDLWRDILEQKYITLGSFVNLIKNPRKNSVSNQWKALVIVNV
jgi:hypothetical protein